MLKNNLEVIIKEPQDEFESRKAMQLQVLDNHIVLGHNEKFRVFDHEASLGKSIQTEKSMVHAWKKEGRKSLYVTLFRDTNEGNSCHERINSYAEETIAIDIDSDNKNEIDKYCEYPVLIITHERYKMLCKDESSWKKYTKERTNLIIDELPNMLDIVEYSVDRINQFANLLPRGAVQNQYNKCIKELENYLKGSKGKSFFNTRLNHDSNLDMLKKLMDSNIDNKYASDKQLNVFKYNAESMEVEIDGMDMDKNRFLNEVEILRSFYKNTCCVENEKAWVFDYRVQFKKLENNLILDANAHFHEVYKLNDDLFSVQRQSRIVSHENWSLSIFKVNTNKSAKRRYADFYIKVKDIIHGMERDKLLLVGSKEDEKYFNGVETEHFGNIIGRNDWRDYNKIVITHNFQVPFHIYVLKYIYYSGKKLDNRTKWEFVRSSSNKSVAFKNDNFENIRISELTSHLYQAIKRINRDNNQNAQVYIFNADTKVLETLKKQFKDIFIKQEIEMTVEKVESESSQGKDIDDDYFARKFLDLLREIMQGKYKDEEVRPNTYTKRWCMKKIGFKDITHFAKRVLYKGDVATFVGENKILTTGNVIRFTKLIGQPIEMYIASAPVCTKQ